MTRAARGALPLTAALTAYVGALGCGGPGAGAARPAPPAIVVGAAVDAGAIVTAPDLAATSGADVAPFDLVFGMNQTCLRTSGHVHCTADFSPDRPLTASPPMEGIEDAVHLAMAGDFGCVVTGAGTVRCFGDNTYGQLGARLRAARSDKPVTVIGVARAKQVVTGDGYACALLGDGTVRCWGRNDSGQTGSSTSYLPAARELVTAEAVEGVKDVSSVVASSRTTCATTRTTHQVICWGRMLPGVPDTLGQGATNGRPAAVEALAGFESISAAEGTFCGVRSGQVHCWGETWSLVKSGVMGASKLEHVEVARARRVRTASSHACAVLVDGAVTCWGTDYHGALGRIRADDGAPLPPELVKGLPPALDVALVGAMSCAITAAREVYCWGFHVGTAARPTATPLRIRLTD